MLRYCLSSALATESMLFRTSISNKILEYIDGLITYAAIFEYPAHPYIMLTCDRIKVKLIDSSSKFMSSRLIFTSSITIDVGRDVLTLQLDKSASKIEIKI